MHVLVESSLFASSYSSSIHHKTKENDGKVQRQKNRNQKIRFILFLILLVFGGYHVYATHVVNTEDTATKIKRKTNLLREKSSNDHHFKIDTNDAGVQIKEDTIHNNKNKTSTQGGSMIRFTVNNLDGIPDRTGHFILQLEPTWAPLGVSRIIELTSVNYWNECRFFRVLPNFIAQFGIASQPSENKKFLEILDDPVQESNARGTVTFATSGPNTRSTQLFINTNIHGNTFLDQQGFTPVGKVIQGLDVVDRLYNEYGEGPPDGQGPNQNKIYSKGNIYLEKNFPKLSYIVSTEFV